MIDLQGKVALVTGAGPNIGREIARTLAAAGAQVLCNDLKPDLAEGAAAYVRDHGGVARATPGDVADPEQMEAIVQQAEEELGGIDILVNNAAITVPKGLFTISLQEWQANLNVVLTGTFVTTRAVAGAMIRKGKGGAIVNIASTSGHRGRRNAIAYTTAKAGILNLTRSLAVELAPHGIRVNSVTPTKTGVSVGAIEQAGERNFSEIPLGRLGRPQDQANAVLFMVSDLAAFITGEDLRVDGGSLSTWGTQSHPDPAGTPRTR